MPLGPAARVSDLVAHPLPPALTGTPGSPDVKIGMLPAWRGLPLAAVAGVAAAQATASTTAQAAEASAIAAMGTPGAPAARAAAEAAKAAAVAAMSTTMSAFTAGGTDLHQCTTIPLTPGHGPGVVITGSATVLINNMPACRMGDQILEAIGPPNVILKGEPTVIIGG